MDRQDVQRSLLRTAPAAALLAPALGLLLGWPWALCFALSAVWGAVNFWLLCAVLETLLLQRSWRRGLVFVSLKTLSLFGGTGALVLAPFFTPIAFLAGVHLVFLLIAAQFAAKSLILARVREEIVR